MITLKYHVKSTPAGFYILISIASCNVWADFYGLKNEAGRKVIVDYLVGEDYVEVLPSEFNPEKILW